MIDFIATEITPSKIDQALFCAVSFYFPVSNYPNLYNQLLIQSISDSSLFI